MLERTPCLRSVVESRSGLAAVPACLDDVHNALARQVCALNLFVQVVNVCAVMLAPVILQRLLHSKLEFGCA